MTKLLNIDANAKTVKGQKKGYMTAVMYLAPYKLSGYNVCPLAEKAGCWQTCLNTAGRGGMPANGYMEANGIRVPDNAIQHARIWRTKLWMEDRPKFLEMLVHEIELFVKKAKRARLTPVVRLNGTSDIQWERIKLKNGDTVFDRFPDLQFYDYTKIVKRLDAPRPSNYYLCLSFSGADRKYERNCILASSRGHSIVMVLRDQVMKEEYLKLDSKTVDGDEHDLRFLDPPGATVLLRAKGQARKETNGFVIG